MPNPTNVKKINTIIEYAIIQYREQENSQFEGKIIQTMRQLPQEPYLLPTPSVLESSSGDSYIHSYVYEWQDETGSPIGSTVSTNQTIYAIRSDIIIPKEAYVECYGAAENSQSMIAMYDVIADINVYLKEVVVDDYVVVPTITYSTNSFSKQISRISFKIVNVNYSSGANLSVPVTLKFYRDEQYTKWICNANIVIHVVCTGQPSGD